MISPHGKIRLLNLNIDSTQKNQIRFSNKTDQETYMLSKKVKEFENYYYMKKDGYIKVKATLDDLWNCDYIMYKNSGFSDKWFYAFITKKEYLSENTVAITFKTDVWQTWFSEIQFRESFVEREHVNVDTIGLHTVPESLELGGYVSNGDPTNSNIGGAHCVLATTYEFDSPTSASGISQNYNGIKSGAIFYLIGDFTSVDALADIIKDHETNGKSDAIVGVFMVPDELTGYIELNSFGWSYTRPGGLNYGPYKRLPESNSAYDMGNTTVTKPSTIDGYTPRNKKLLTYPFCYLLGDNNTGSAGEYRYEYFSTSNCVFNLKGAITPGCSIKAIPLNYQDQSSNFLEGLVGAKYPLGSINTEVYANWMAQNSINVATQLVGSGVQIAGGLGLMATGGGAVAGASAIGSGLLGISSTLGTIHQHKMMPDQLNGNVNNGDVVYASGKTDFSYYKMSIKEEYAKIIDEYFDMFGYKVGRVKDINITSRLYWNYIKTIDCNIIGNIPGEDLIEIKDIFNRGCTFWSNGDNIGNYSLNNVII